MMKNKIVFFLINFIFLLNINLLGENRTKIKLPSKEINELIMDKKGFVWIGTDKGLLRYDGDEYELYSEDVFEKKSLAFDKVTFIKELENELILANEKGDFSLFDLNKKGFKNYKVPNNKKIIEVLKKNEDTIFLLTSTSLFQFNTDNKLFYEIYKGKNMKNIFYQEDKLIIVEGDKIIKIIDEKIKEDLFRGMIDLSFYHSGNMYISQNRHLYKVGNESLENIIEMDKEIKKILKTKIKDTYALVTFDTVFLYNILEDRIIREYKKDFSKELLLVSRKNEFWFKDENLLELINFDRDYYEITENNKKNEKIFVYNKIKYVYRNKSLYRIYKNKETLIKEGEIENINYFNNNFYFTIDDILYKNFEKYMTLESRPDNIIIDKNLMIINFGKKIIVKGKIEKTFEIDTEVNKIEFDLNNKNIIWLGTKEKALLKLDIELNQLEFIRNVLRDGKYYKIDEVEDFVLLKDKVIIYSPQGNLLIYDYRGKFIKANMEINRLKNTSFVEDQMGNIWFGTNSNIYRFDSELESIYDFTKEINKKFDNIKNAYIDQEGNIYFSYNGGYIEFCPNKIIDINEENPIAFREAFLGEEERTKDITYSDKLYIPYWNKSFTIKFSLLDYFKDKDRNYVYKLKGQRDRWIRLNNKNEVSFAFLPSGRYTLEVSYFDINNKLSGFYDEIDIYIEAKPWQSVGAYFLYITLAFIIAEFIRRYKLKGNKLILHKELQKLSNIFFNIENSKDMTSEFMEKLCLFIGLIDVKIFIKEYKQEYVTCYTYNLYSNYLEEEVLKDDDNISLKDKKDDVYFELETDIINNLSMCRKKDDDIIEFLFDLDEKFSGRFIFGDTESRHKKDKFLYKAEMLLRQFIINYKNRVSFEEISKLANFDSLTGIYNRRYFDQMALLNLEQSRRYEHNMTIAIFDIDYFKHINDNYGHQTGDKVLVEIADRIKENIRETDIFARYGGEEFIICFTETDRNRAMLVCDRIRREIEREDFVIERKKVGITTTIGLAELHQEDTLDTLIKRADIALYQGKKTGKNKGVIQLNENRNFVDISTLINGQLA